MTRKFFIITGIFSFFTFFVQWGFTGFLGLISAIIQIVLCAGLATLFISIFQRDRSLIRLHFFRSFLIVSSLFGFFSLILLLFIGYQNTFPTALGKITISNGEKTVVFHQMSHIATPEFYSQVEDSLVSLVSSGYTVYAEGIRPGSPENQEKLDTLIGFKMTDTLYETFATQMGLMAQDESLYDRLATGSVRNVDISLDDLMSRVASGTLSSFPPIDLEAELAQFQTFSDSFLMAPFFRAVLNYLVAQNTFLDTYTSVLTPEVADIILHDRNEYIVETLLRDPSDRIILVYGALHFQGVYELLQSEDPRWKVMTIEQFYPYSFPYVKYISQFTLIF